MINHEDRYNGYNAYCKGEPLNPGLSDSWQAGWLEAEASHVAASYEEACEEWDREANVANK